MPLNLSEFRCAWRPMLAIGTIVATLAGGFAWTAGAIPFGRVTSEDVLAALQVGGPKPFPPGYRRAHGKGLCFTGTFHGNGAAAALSEASAFARIDLPVTGRFSLGAGDPHAADGTAATLGMAMMIIDRQGEQWRTAMNRGPFLSVGTPEGFRAQVLAFQPDPATGKPDPVKVRAFLANYPEAARYIAWDKATPRANSWATTEYNGMHAFRLVAADGSSHFVRWRMQPHLPFVPWSSEESDRAGADYLTGDIKQRLVNGPLRWDMVLTLAGRGDAIEDPSALWSAQDRQVVAGTLEITDVSPNATGHCRDVNFDPTILPPGIEISDDPVLAARSGAYSHSFNAREREIGFGTSSGKDGAR